MSKRKILLFFVSILAFFAIFPSEIQAEKLDLENAFSGIVKIKLFVENEAGYLNHVSSGSGAIINSDGLVLTNHHVISKESTFDSGLEKEVAYQICVTHDSDKEPNCGYTASFVASDKDKDLALLKIKSIDEIEDQDEFSYLDISYDSVNTDDEIKVLGYPGVGGDTITITGGTISGKETKYEMDWLKTDADISFGSSGGAAVSENGELVGIPTQSHSSELVSTGYLLEISSVKDWIENNKDSEATQSNLEERMIDLTKKQKDIENSNKFVLDKPAFELTKKDGWTFDYIGEDQLIIKNEENQDGGQLIFTWDKYLYDIETKDLVNILRNTDSGIFLMGGKIVKSEDVNIGGVDFKKVRISLLGEVKSFYLYAHKNYYFGIVYDYGKDEQDKEAIKEIVGSMEFKDFESNIDKNEYKIFNNDFHNIKTNLQNSDWLAKNYNNLTTPGRIEFEDSPEAVAKVVVEKKGSEMEGLTNNEIYNMDVNQLESSFEYISRSGGYDMKILDAKSYSEINDNIKDAIMFEIQISDEDENILSSLSYEIYGSDKIYTLELRYSGSDMDRYEEIKRSFKEDVLSGLQIEGYNSDETSGEVMRYKDESEENIEEEVEDIEGESPGEPTDDVKDENNDDKDISSEEINLNNKRMYQRLKGKIILKVEDKGKAYYVNPGSQKMSFLGKPKNAFELMRSQGVGISNENLSKIPVGLLDESLGEDSDGDGLSDMLEDALGTDKNNSDSDGDGYNDKEELRNNYSPLKRSEKMKINSEFANKKKGKIFIQVEGQGEAWYVNPHNGKRYFLGRPANAFMVMRKLGLGVSDQSYENLKGVKGEVEG